MAQSHPPMQSMEQVAIAPLNDLLAQLTSLTTLLASSNSTSTYSALPNIVSSLTTADDSLSTSLSLLRQHQSNYARILTLRAQTEQLDADIKSIVRKADSLRTEISHISADILDDSEDEETVNDVDYETLLAFAARIGKHNSIAAQEAEWEGERLKTQSRSGPNDGSLQAESDSITRQKAEMDVAISHQRAMMGMSFPDNNILRLGALGPMSVLRESDQGEAAVDNEIQKLVRETEAISRSDQSIAEVERVRAEEEERESKDREWREREAAKKRAAAAKKQQQGDVKTTKPATPKKKTLSLDFDDSDDDED